MNEHITRLEVKNFKKFDHLIVENIGQINLITGDNNVGKTSLLESILIANDDIDLSLKYLHQTLCTKNVHIHPENINSKNPVLPAVNFFDYLKRNKKAPVEFVFNNSSIAFEDCTIDDLFLLDFEKQKPDNYNIGRPNKWIRIYKEGKFEELQWMYLDDFKRNMKYGYHPFVGYDAGYRSDVNYFYGETIGDNNIGTPTFININGDGNTTKFKELDFEEKRRFIQALSLFVADIEDTTIKGYFRGVESLPILGERDILSLKTKSNDTYQPITFWGEGFNTFVRYLLEITKNKDKFLLIDEIGSGVHWTKMKDFWLQIMKTSHINNVQLYCTTHSQDCIIGFMEAGKEFEEIKNQMRLIELEEFSLNDKLRQSATTYDFETLKYKLSTDTNVRGGDVWR